MVKGLFDLFIRFSMSHLKCAEYQKLKSSLRGWYGVYNIPVLDTWSSMLDPEWQVDSICRFHWSIGGMKHRKVFLLGSNHIRSRSTSPSFRASSRSRLMNQEPLQSVMLGMSKVQTTTKTLPITSLGVE